MIVLSFSKDIVLRTKLYFDKLRLQSTSLKKVFLFDDHISEKLFYKIVNTGLFTFNFKRKILESNKITSILYLNQMPLGKNPNSLSN